jgi:hypothetical protein
MSERSREKEKIRKREARRKKLQRIKDFFFKYREPLSWVAWAILVVTIVAACFYDNH